MGKVHKQDKVVEDVKMIPQKTIVVAKLTCLQEGEDLDEEVEEIVAKLDLIKIFKQEHG